MKPAAVIAASLVSACAGWWLPAFWIKETPRPARSILPSPREARIAAAPESLDAAVRRASSAMAQFQAVAAAVKGRGASLAMMQDAFTGLTCIEAEELAASLAGEELARAAGDDGPAFLRSLTGLGHWASYSAFAAWAEARPAAAVRLLLTPEARDYLYSGIADRLIRRDPAQALDILRTTPLAEGTITAWSLTLNAIAEQNPAAALVALHSAPAQNRDPYLCGMLARMAGKDVHAALQWAAQLPPELYTENARQALYQRWSHDDPAAAAAHWLAADARSFAQHQENLLRDWAGKDPAAALRWAEDHGLSLPETALASIAAHDPQRAIALLGQLDRESRSASLEGQIAERWAATDYPAALKWVRDLESKTARDSAFAHLAGVARSLPEAEQRAFIAAADPADRYAFYVLHGLNQDEALKSFATFTTDKQHDAWLYLEARLDHAPPEQAAPFLQQVLAGTPNSSHTAHASELVARWSQNDPAAAAAWVDTLPPGEAQNWAAANLATNWARHDPAAATAWTHRLPPGPARQKAEEQLAALASKP